MCTQTEIAKNHNQTTKIIPYNHRLAPLFIRDALFSIIPRGTQHVLVAGIGSNRINGDSVGPFVGTLLEDLYPKHLTVLGNLQYPLDAATLNPALSKVEIPNHSFIVAIDSVLGSEEFVNSIIVQNCSLNPGVGIGNSLPPVGDCSVMGVVLTNDCTFESSLLYTDLHLVFTMATNIAKGISLAVRQYFKYPAHQSILSRPYL
jgi:putative sporulation protein YyaC